MSRRCYVGEEKIIIAAQGKLWRRIHTLDNEVKIKVFTPFYIVKQTSTGMII